MTRHRKFLKAEKARTKLKGANLPKGLNVTKTEFKVRKIVIPELKKKELEPGARPRYTVQECLTKLNHSNLSHRLEGISCLKRMLETNFDEIKNQFLAKIVQAISAMSIDIEREVRREASQFLGSIFCKLGEATMEPFFDIICCYLRCAMTHITPSIQEDSLLLLDTLLVQLPSLVADKKNKILENFLDMISKLKNDSQPTRTLTVRLGSKLSSNKWRIRVLERLDSLFAAIVSEERKAKHGKLIQSKPDVDENQKMDEGVFVSPDENEEVFDPLDNLPDFSDIIISTTEAGTVTIKDEGEKIKLYIEAIVPLLFETWIEAKSDEGNTIQPKNAIITTETAQNLRLVLKVLIHLISLVRLYECDQLNELSNWFKVQFFNDFLQHFLNGFPYRLFVRPGKKQNERKGQKKDNELVDNVFFQNLSISKIFILHGSSGQDEAQAVLEYLKYCTTHIHELQDNTNLFLSLLRGIFTEVSSFIVIFIIFFYKSIKVLKFMDLPPINPPTNHLELQLQLP